VLDAVRRPGLLLGPCGLGEWIEDYTPVCPCFHVGSGIDVVILHRETHSIILVVARIYPKRIAENMCRGIGCIHVVDNRILGYERAGAEAKGKKCGLFHIVSKIEEK